MSAPTTVCRWCHVTSPCFCDGVPPVEPADDEPAPSSTPRPRRAVRRSLPIEPVHRPAAVHPSRAPGEYRTPLEDLQVAVDELLALLPELIALVPEAGAPLDAGTSAGGKRVAAPIPWNDAAALTFFAIHGDARRYESLLSVRLYGRAQYRAGTNAETAAVLSRLPQLIRYGRDVGLPHLDLDDVTRDLLAWPRQVRILLGRPRAGDESTTPVPGRPSCPTCSRTLVLSAGWRVLEQESVQAMCPRCRDDDGRPLAWPVTEWVGHLQHDELVTVEDASARYGVRPSTLWSWKRRGRIHHYGEDERGRHLYRVRDVLALSGQPAADDPKPAPAVERPVEDARAAERTQQLLEGLVDY